MTRRLTAGKPGTYRGEGKTDARDAFVIADQARVRRDLGLLLGDEIAVDLRILTTRRSDLVADRTRQINRLRAQLLEIFPALERAFDYGKNKAVPLFRDGVVFNCLVESLECWSRHTTFGSAAAYNPQTESASRRRSCKHAVQK